LNVGVFFSFFFRPWFYLCHVVATCGSFSLSDPGVLCFYGRKGFSVPLHGYFLTFFLLRSILIARFSRYPPPPFSVRFHSWCSEMFLLSISLVSLHQDRRVPFRRRRFFSRHCLPYLQTQFPDPLPSVSPMFVIHPGSAPSCLPCLVFGPCSP